MLNIEYFHSFFKFFSFGCAEHSTRPGMLQILWVCFYFYKIHVVHTQVPGYILYHRKFYIYLYLAFKSTTSILLLLLLLVVVTGNHSTGHQILVKIIRGIIVALQTSNGHSTHCFSTQILF